VAEPATPHATHDQALVAAYAADDLAGTAHGAAEQLLARCPACARLADDLRAIALATRALPAPVRPRSFTIAPEQAERLRPTGWRRLVGSGRRPELGLLRPLAATLTTLGVAGLLLTALPAGPAALLGVAGRTDGRAGAPAVTEDLEQQHVTAPPPTEGQFQGAQRPEPVPLASPAAGQASGRKTESDQGGPGTDTSNVGDAGADAGGGPDASGEPARDGEVAAVDSGPAEAPRWLLVLSLALLAAGLGLFAAYRLQRDD
jgi:hypothetical protein